MCDIHHVVCKSSLKLNRYFPVLPVGLGALATLQIALGIKGTLVLCLVVNDIGWEIPCREKGIVSTQGVPISPNINQIKHFYKIIKRSQGIKLTWLQQEDLIVFLLINQWKEVISYMWEFFFASNIVGAQIDSNAM